AESVSRVRTDAFRTAVRSGSEVRLKTGDLTSGFRTRVSRGYQSRFAMPPRNGSSAALADLEVCATKGREAGEMNKRGRPGGLPRLGISTRRTSCGLGSDGVSRS